MAACEKIIGLGHNRFTPLQNYIESDEGGQVVIVPMRPVLECAREFPAHYLLGIILNTKLNDCCRDPENLGLEIRKTQDIPMDEPDLYVFQCGCGRKQRRLLCESGGLGNPEKKPNHVHNPLFKHYHGEKYAREHKTP